MNPHPDATLLVVDDIPANIATLAAMLRDHYRVVFATNGRRALEIAREQPIDLVLLDVMMPEMDGYEVCRQLKADLATRDIPVIFVSALGEANDEAHGLDLGAADFLHKPCHPAIVRARVEMQLERHQQQRLLERLVRERTAELLETRKEIIRRLGRAGEYRDNETGQHVIRMAQLAYLLARAAGLPENQAALLRDAAPMHDVGKIGIPDHILRKPGKLDPDEWALMQRHTLIGAEIIGEHPSDLMRLARSIALTHHEKWNGSGYPNGLADTAIPREGRITAIADVFDALTSERPYKRAWPLADAFAYLADEAGRSFDPELVAHFLNLREQAAEVLLHYAEPA